MSIETEFAKLEKKIEGWWAYLTHHKSKGVVPPATIPDAPPIPAPAPPAAAPTPTAPSPAPAPVQAPTPAPTATRPAWAASDPDARGFIKLTAVENERANNPAWAKACEWYNFESTLTAFTLTDAQKLSINGNLTEAKTVLFMGDVPPLDSRSLNPAYAMTAGSNDGFGYVRGAQYTDALSFIGTNRNIDGTVIYQSPTPDMLEQFVQTCNANNKLPLIGYQGQV